MTARSQTPGQAPPAQPAQYPPPQFGGQQQGYPHRQPPQFNGPPQYQGYPPQG